MSDPLTALRPALELPSTRWLLALCAVLGVIMCLTPLLNVLGVESALILGVVLPPLCALSAARIAIAARGSGISAMELCARTTAASLALLLVPVSLIALNALRVRNCDPLQGLLFIGLGPTPGVLLAAVVGSCCGALPLGRRLSTALALAVPLATIALALHWLYTTPAIFAYGHFFGYHPGTFYDELVTLPRPLLTLRLTTLALTLGLLAGLRAHFDPEHSQLSRTPRTGHRTLQLVCAGALLLTLVVELHGAELGHRTSAANIEHVLGGQRESARCELIYPREMHRARVDRLAEHCDERVEQMERWLGLTHRRRVRVYMFRSAGEKRALMGAAGTNVAKPWTGEIYLQDRDWPHPVLAHEMAHVIAAETGVGPFRINGGLGGLWPNPALIEGLAVAAAWAGSSRAGMTPHQWVRALIALDMAPALQDVVGADFYAQQKRMAYTVTGSLLRYVADTHGTAALRAIYRTGDIEAVLQRPLAQLEQEWRAYLQSVPLPDEALALAELRFAGGSIFSSVCPHTKAELREELNADVAAGDDPAAIRTCAAILDVDPAEVRTRAALVTILARSGQMREAREQLATLIGPPAAPPTVIAAAKEGLADEAWRNGDLHAAAQIYAELLEQPNGRDARRQLQVKSLALQGGDAERGLLQRLLLGEPGRSTGGTLAVYLMRELRAERSDGLPHYLEARQLFFRGRYGESAALHAQARELGLPTEDIEIEALRVQAISEYGRGNLPQARRLFHQLRTLPVEQALGVEAEDWLERIHLRTRSAKGAS